MSQPPVCILCKERCGQFLCPCCGMHNTMPWKCDICTDHAEPCLAVQRVEPASPWAGCLLLLLLSATIFTLAIIGAVQVIRAIIS